MTTVSHDKERYGVCDIDANKYFFEKTSKNQFKLLEVY